MTTPAENAATNLAASLRTVMTQGERAMIQLGWTMANTNWRGTLAALLAQAEAAEILQDKLDVEREVHAQVEDERDAAVRERDQAREALRQFEWLDKKKHDRHSEAWLKFFEEAMASARAALTRERTEPEDKYGDWRDDPGNYGE